MLENVRMLILPVIDLQARVAVHGRAGHREDYRPVQSVLADGADPVALARGCLTQLGLRQIYLADLDAIAGSEPAWSVHQSLLDQGIHLWLDAGIGHSDQLDRVCSRYGTKVDVVLGLETLCSPLTLRSALSKLGPQRTVVSLDMDEGIPRTRIAAWSKLDALSLAQTLLNMGLRRLILLDIRRVGMQQGTGTRALLHELRATGPDLQLTCGGGIRGMDDILQLAADGCDAVLIATALHDGRIGRAEIERLSGTVQSEPKQSAG
jgi:phosphoribosylformimino-5-aminoimidazole carboxamide ribotide isomerase